jgi:hypothetical protein
MKHVVADHFESGYLTKLEIRAVKQSDEEIDTSSGITQDPAQAIQTVGYSRSFATGETARDSSAEYTAHRSRL